MPLLGILGLALVSAWVIVTVNQSSKRARLAQGQAELRAKLLDKLGSGAEALEFMKTETGQKLLEPVRIAVDDAGLQRVVRSVQGGIVLAALGIGFLTLAHFWPGEAESMSIGGVLSLALGAGMLISAVVSYYLSKSWGLVGPRDSRQP